MGNCHAQLAWMPNTLAAIDLCDCLQVLCGHGELCGLAQPKQQWDRGGRQFLYCAGPGLHAHRCASAARAAEVNVKHTQCGVLTLYTRVHKGTKAQADSLSSS